MRTTICAARSPVEEETFVVPRTPRMTAAMRSAAICTFSSLDPATAYDTGVDDDAAP